MKEVYQTLFGEEGNCFDACLASILEMPLDKMPNMVKVDTGWLDEYNRWLISLGLQLITVSYDTWHPKGYSILSGKAERGLMHAVVAFDGQIIHDPFFGSFGLETYETWTLIILNNPSIYLKQETILKAEGIRCR